MIKDYGSYISWKAIYISNDLVDFYLPTTTLLLIAGIVIIYKIVKRKKSVVA